MEHIHKYDSEGRQLCCTQEEKIYKQAGAKILIGGFRKYRIGEHNHSHNHTHEFGDTHTHSKVGNNLQMFLYPTISLVGLIIAIALDNYLSSIWLNSWYRPLLYLLSYIPVGLPVIKESYQSILKGEIFSEFLLMTIATIGAFAIFEYPEAVAVMLFYAVGESLQTLAIRKAKNNIQTLIDQRPDKINIIENNHIISKNAVDAQIGEIIQLKSGEKLALDGILVTETASFDTSSLTGESLPMKKVRGDTILAGMINLNSLSQVKITTEYQNSKLSQIIELIENATTHKAPTELFIRKFAKYYTPIVVVLAIFITLAPFFVVNHYVFSDWLYRALIFLVIACPCALVISIPLGYFGGIGAASKNGILFKGSNFLDVITNIQNIVFDKTGTLTKGKLSIQDIIFDDSYNHKEILDMINAVETVSTHHIATAIHSYVGDINPHINIESNQELPGYGLRAIIDKKELLVGNFKLLELYGIEHGQNKIDLDNTIVAVAYNRQYVGYLTIADSIKEDAAATIETLNLLNINTMLLSGDKNSIVSVVAAKLGIKSAYGELLPDDKYNKILQIQQNGQSVAFVGDGINDAPVIALSNVGIAMGGLGSDTTIQVADVVIQDDKPSKIIIAINIAKATKIVVWQNIIMAFAVKLIVLILGAGGIATMWEAVFADVGVALLAIVNAVRIQKMNFE